MSPGRPKLSLILATILVLAGGVFISPKKTLAAAGINKQINFQGKVVNTDGTNVSPGFHTFVFKIYNDTTLVWTDTETLTVTDGIFQYNLGSDTGNAPLPGSVDFNTDNVYLGVEFDSNGEMSPRIRFTAAPYAFNADNLDGKDWTTPGTIGSTTPNSAVFTTTTIGTTATYDPIAISPVAKGSNPFTGTISSLDLTGAHAWNFPNADGTVALTANKLSDFAATTSAELLGNISDETGTGKLTFATSPTFLTGITLGDSSGATFVLTSALSGATDPTLTFGNDLITTSGDLQVSGGELYITGITSSSSTTEGTIYYDNDDDNLYVYAAGGWVDLTVQGGAQTPWAQDIGAAGFDLGSLSNLGFQETTGAPAGTAVGLFRDNTGDLNANVLTGKTFNLQVNGVDEYNFSSTGLAMNSNTITGAASYNGLVITADTGAITTGTWNGTDIAVADGGTGTSTGSITGTTALTFTAGGTAQNINLTTSTTGAVVVGSTTATTDTIKIQPKAGAASFAGIITTADLTVADKTYTFPDVTGTVALTANNLSDFAATTSLELLGNISDETGSGKLAFATSPTFLTGITLGDSAGATFVLTSALSGVTDPTLTFGNDLITVSGDLKITGDDLYMNTNTSGYVLVADGASFNPVLMSGDVSIGTGGVTAIATDAVHGTMMSLASEATGDTMYFNGTDWIRLAAANGGVLTSSATAPSWVASTSGTYLLQNANGTITWVAPPTTHTQNTDTGTTGVSFVIGSGTNETTNDVTLTFGNSAPETLVFDGNGTDNFLLSDDLDITGGLTATADISTLTQLKIRENTDAAFYGIFDVTNLTTADKTYLFPDLSGTVALSTNNLSIFASTTSAQLSGVLSDENTSGGYMTNVMSAAGDMIYGTASGVPARLAESGVDGYVLKMNTTTHIPYWSTDLTGGVQTPWAQDINAAGFDLGSLSNLGFQETTGAPTGTDVGLYRDNTGDLSANVLTGKTLNVAVNAVDEYNFSATGLAFNSNNITGLGTNLTAAGALTIASTTTGLTLNSGSNTLTIDSSDTSLSASGVTTLTLGAGVAITNASGNISFQPAGTGTANVQIGDGGATSATPDLLVLDVGSAEPAGTVGAMYYSTALTKFRCYQGAAWADCIGAGGSQTPWTSDINAAGFDLGSLSNLGFQETTGAPTGTDVGLYRDNTGDLSANVLTGKTLNVAVNAVDEYNFSATGLAFNSNNITGLGTNLTAAAGLTIASATASGLAIDSGTTGAIDVGTSANAKTITIGNATTTTAVNINSGTGGIKLEVAGNSATGSVQIGTGGTGVVNPDLLKLDVRDSGTAGDPTGADGAMYYSKNTNSFRCYQNSAWTNCIGSGSGGGDNITVNAVAATDANFSDTTVVAPSGGANVKWQRDTSTPNNISAYFDFGDYSMPFKKKPTFATDFNGGVASTTVYLPYLGAVVGTGGTIAAAAAGIVNGDHPGVIALRSGTASGAGYRYSTDAGSIRLKGGEVFNGVMRHESFATETVRLGFHDATTATTPVDGCFFEIPTTGLAVGKCANSSTTTATTGSYQIALSTWYSYRITMNSNATLATFEIFNSAGTSLFTTNNTVSANIPTASGREMGTGIIATSTRTAAAVLVNLDYMSYSHGSTSALAR